MKIYSAAEIAKKLETLENICHHLGRQAARDWYYAVDKKTFSFDEAYDSLPFEIWPGALARRVRNLMEICGLDKPHDIYDLARPGWSDYMDSRDYPRARAPRKPKTIAPTITLDLH